MDARRKHTNGKGTTNSGNWVTAVYHGKYMDVVPVGNVSGSSSTYYSDIYWISTSASRVVYRGFYNAYAGGGVVSAYAYYDAAFANAIVGSRLAFHGKSSGRKASVRSKR